MSKTKKLTVSALISALCVACLSLTALVPRVTLALTALAGIFPAAAIIACGYGWGAASVIAAGLLGFLILPDKTGVLWFLLFFGHYPFWKLAIERIQTRLGNAWVGWMLKIAGFAVFFLLMYYLFHEAFTKAIPLNFPSATYLSAAFGLICVCFILYDIAFSILIGVFRIKILPRLK